MKPIFVLLSLVLLAVIERAQVSATLELITFPNVPDPPDGQDRNCSADFAAYLKSGVTDGPAPQCDAEHGGYRAMQVYIFPMWTVRPVTCVTKGGRKLLHGNDIKSCDCHRVRYDIGELIRKKVVQGGPIPSCNDTTGYFTPVQSDASTGQYWCADKDGKVIGQKTLTPPLGC